MNTTELIPNKMAEQKAPLPKLIEGSSTYKMIVPAKVEEKIRYLIRKYPHTEWSGVLFYSHTGGFETNDLVITCEDIFPMDLGTGGWTEFKMTEDVTAYIAENIELFSCDLGLIHSHHSMGAFFSGQDLKTLQNEGNDTNCFVSLIVDTKGTYQAAVTRKIKTKKKIVFLNSSYEFFGGGEFECDNADKEKTVEDVCIEYFMLDVQREVVNNPFDYLDSRFNEIVNSKNRTPKTGSVWDASPYKLNDKALKDWATANKAKSFYDWLHGEDKTNKKENKIDDAKAIEVKDFDPDSWEPDPKIIHHLVIQMLTASLIISSDINIKQWIERHMVRKYKEIFNDHDEFIHWVEIYVEFILYHYPNNNVPDDVLVDFDFFIGKVAGAIHAELEGYPKNDYIDDYKEELINFIV